MSKLLTGTVQGNHFVCDQGFLFGLVWLGLFIDFFFILKFQLFLFLAKRGRQTQREAGFKG